MKHTAIYDPRTRTTRTVTREEGLRLLALSPRDAVRVSQARQVVLCRDPYAADVHNRTAYLWRESVDAVARAYSAACDDI